MSEQRNFRGWDSAAFADEILHLDIVRDQLEDKLQAAEGERDELKRQLIIAQEVLVKDDHYHNVREERDQLKEALALAVKGLEFYSTFNDEPRIYDSISLMARTTLAQIRAKVPGVK